MKYPKLVRKAKTPVHITIEAEETNEFGERETVVDGDFKGNYQSKSTIRHLSDKETEIITGVIYFDGDIAPSVAEISGGFAEIFGEQREIASGTKGRNPDGTVNFTRLGLK